MTPTKLLDHIENLFATRGGAEYHGEAVTELEHALQAAFQAEQEGQGPAVVAAALLHDVGHLLHGYGEGCAEKGIDDRHEELGVRLLEKGFGPEVTEPVRMHVAAKRYLCSSKPGYAAGLSPASTRSLELQGGLMSDEERRSFESSPHFKAALKVREYDDKAKIVGLPTPTFAHFRICLESCLRGNKMATGLPLPDQLV